MEKDTRQLSAAQLQQISGGAGSTDRLLEKRTQKKVA